MVSGKRFLYPDQFEACECCHGNGTVRCSYCSGTGLQEVRRSGYDASDRYYSDTERETCTVCGGKGVRLCNPCGGTGDQRQYQSKGSSVEETEDAAPEDDEGDGEPRSQEVYSPTSYDAILILAKGERERIIQWVWVADAFSPDYKSRINTWLSSLALQRADASRLLDETAEQLNQPGLATQVGTLRLKLIGLSSLCADLQSAKATEGARSVGCI